MFKKIYNAFLLCGRNMVETEIFDFWIKYIQKAKKENSEFRYLCRIQTRFEIPDIFS